jgi:hypothetical protein
MFHCCFSWLPLFQSAQHPLFIAPPVIMRSKVPLFSCHHSKHFHKWVVNSVLCEWIIWWLDILIRTLAV